MKVYEIRPRCVSNTINYRGIVIARDDETVCDALKRKLDEDVSDKDFSVYELNPDRVFLRKAFGDLTIGELAIFLGSVNMK